MSETEPSESQGLFTRQVLENGNRVEITGDSRELLAHKAHELYCALGGQEETADSAFNLLVRGAELRPGSGIYAIGLRENGTLYAEVRNAPGDLERQAKLRQETEKVFRSD